LEVSDVVSIIDDETGKYKLLKVKQVNVEGNIYKAKVEEISITDIFDNFSLDTSFKMVDLPEEQPETQSVIKTLSVKKDGKVTKKYEWDSNFFMEEDYENLIKEKRKSEIHKLDTTIEEKDNNFIFKSSNGIVRAEIKIPKIVKPGEELKAKINVYSEKVIENFRLKPDTEISPWICKINIDRVVPTEEKIQNIKDLIGNFELNEPRLVKEGSFYYYLYWKPKENDYFTEYRYNITVYFGSGKDCSYGSEFGKKVVLENVSIASAESTKGKIFKLGKLGTVN